MKSFGFALLAGVIGYVVGTGIGIGLVQVLSSNRHDRSQEAVMTGFFVTGPIVAILAFLGTWIWRLFQKG